MPSIKDIAALAEVSQTTVSRVLNNRGYLSEKTKQKVFQAMKDLHYQPNQIARALHNSKSKLFAAIVPDSSNPFFSELIKTIEEICHDKGYRLILCNSLGNIKKEHSYLEILQGQNIDGLIVCSHLLQIKDYEYFPFPIVSFEKSLLPNIPIVTSDNYNGGMLAARHLYERGCKNILHISGPLDDYTLLGHDRFRAFADYCDSNKINYDVIKTDKHFDFSYYMSFLSELPSVDLKKYDGAFCSNDLLAYALYVTAINNGINVPRDLKIVGFDNSLFTQILQQPKITTISQNIHKIANELINMLIAQQTTNYINEKIVVEVEFIEGTTT